MEVNLCQAACILHCMTADETAVSYAANEENEPEPGGNWYRGNAR